MTAGSGWPDDIGEREYVTAAQAAAYLQVHVRTIYLMALDKRLTAYHPTGLRAKRFRRTDVEALFSTIEHDTDDDVAGPPREGN